MKIHELHEGFLDWFSSDKPADMKKDVIPMVKQLLKKGMPENKIIAKVEKELHVRPRYVKQAITMVQAGINEVQTTQDDLAKMKQISANVQKANQQGDAGAAMQAGAELGDMLTNKVYPDMLKVIDKMVRELEVACKKYASDPNWAEQCKQLPQIKADLEANKRQAMKKGMPYGRQDVDEDASKGAAILARIDMALDGSGLKRQGFELVKDTNSFTRGSITREAEAAIRNSLAKAKAMLGGVEPEDPKPTISKADITDKDFGVGEGMYETTSSSIAVAPVAVGNTMQKRNPDGTAVNAQDQNTNLMGGKKKPNKKKKA